VFHQGKQLGYGIGGSKKAAEVNAAVAALDVFDHTQNKNNITNDKTSEPETNNTLC
jgi:hypothetical protein